MRGIDVLENLRTSKQIHLQMRASMYGNIIISERKDGGCWIQIMRHSLFVIQAGNGSMVYFRQRRRPNWQRV